MKDGNLALSRLDYAADEERDSVERETEEKTELVEMVGSNEPVEDEGKQTEDEEEEVEEEDGDDYFQDPTDICKYCGGKCALFTHNSPVFTFPVPAIDPIPTERFPEYVRDMLYGEENKLKAEFSVRYPCMVITQTCLSKQCKCMVCVLSPHTGGGSVMFMFTYTGPGKATSTTLYCGSPASQQGTQQIQQHLSM